MAGSGKGLLEGPCFSSLDTFRKGGYISVGWWKGHAVRHWPSPKELEGQRERDLTLSFFRFRISA